MKVLHTISSMGVLGGGPSLSTLLTVDGLRMNGVDAEILSYKPSHPDDTMISNAHYIDVVDALPDKRFAFSPAYKKAVQKHLQDIDIIHVQGIWQYPSHVSAVLAQQNNKPYMIALRGMMYPQAMQHSAIIKKISMALYQRADLQKASCIQATCLEEYRHYRSMGFTNPVAILPNPIAVEGIIEKSIPTHSIKRIGYIGRLHSRKRVEKLIYAFDKIRDRLAGCELLIIGGGDKVYEKFLRDEVERLHLDNVRFTGFLSGTEKDIALNSLSYLFVPSDFENFGNIVTEALVRGIPVAASKGTPWQELEKYQCGWWIDNDITSITDAILQAITLPEEERKNMGLRGKEYVKSTFSVEVLGMKMKSVYEWILGGNAPDYVYTE